MSKWVVVVVVVSFPPRSNVFRFFAFPFFLVLLSLPLFDKYVIGLTCAVRGRGVVSVVKSCVYR